MLGNILLIELALATVGALGTILYYNTEEEEL